MAEISKTADNLIIRLLIRKTTSTFYDACLNTRKIKGEIMNKLSTLTLQVAFIIITCMTIVAVDSTSATETTPASSSTSEPQRTSTSTVRA